MTESIPSEEAILAWLKASDRDAGKRDIARHFGLSAQGKIALKARLKDMENDGRIERGEGRHYRVTGSLPKLCTLKVVRITEDGDAIAEPEDWRGEGAAPRMPVFERRDSKSRQRALGVGDRVLVRIETKASGRMRAHPLKRLERKIEPMLGIIRKSADGWRLESVDRKLRLEGVLHAEDMDGAEAGELVRADPVGKASRFGMQRFRVVERLGSPLAPRAFSLIAIYQHQIPVAFSDEALEDAKAAAALNLGAREDLRDFPLITIDPADARDHDDAICARPREDGGHDLIIAIADVSFFVRPGTMLDGDARSRGNSVYFPDRVVPMLPEVLSADVCSLLPDVDRACLAAHLTIDAQGQLKAFRFSRSVMRSKANLAYEDAQAQSAQRPELIALWNAWRALCKARDARAPLDLDLPERRAVLDEAGRIAEIKTRERLEAHRVVEDFMILANVAAALQLEKKKSPVVYRLHEAPTREKLASLRDFFESLGEKLALGQVVKAETFNRLIERTKDHEAAALIQEMILRTQTQAYYGLEKLGHFGLSLASYAHFTSPIRRYSDLLVHRALVKSLGLGEGSLSDADAAQIERTAEHVSRTERRAMIAERDTMDRYVAAFLAGREGEMFDAKITGVARFGLFVALEGIGGDGLLPISALGDERFVHDEKAHRLEGTRTGTAYGLGQPLKVQLTEARPATGGLLFGLADAPEAGLTPGEKPPNRPRFKRRGLPRRK
jgi:ribonuclease R